ncbi:hypothetical protein GCM10023347_27270 [Streptomyces chumphonensis]|uniref:Uncharacterized protein n=1 Tax=Streptomyces chumphonensis TaxID=1214925 RepID=A0A927IDC9_9ACTN|nr:hypothetical protein [Streptomyces chumphonensis]MBD3932534.1 hypothetical protein [Streptomyces chumphonensis]
MFELRVICDPADADRITTALNTTFETGPVRRLPSRHSAQARLYITADHRPDTETATWPAPEDAYATAPSIIREIGWTADAAASRPVGTTLGREFWLRKAAVLDRIALTDHAPGDADEVAAKAAQRLVELDDVTGVRDARGYVRQQYARWACDQ